MGTRLILSYHIKAAPKAKEARTDVCEPLAPMAIECIIDSPQAGGCTRYPVRALPFEIMLLPIQTFSRNENASKSFGFFAETLTDILQHPARRHD